MRVELMDVTPDMAVAWLADNGHNRSLNRNRAATLAAAMRSGEWQVNGETIIISGTGKLLDGQHRLKAVTLFGRSVPMLVATGADDGAFKTIDTGRTRSSGDILSMSQIKNPTAVSATAKLIWQMMHGQPMTSVAPVSYLLKVYERFPSLEKWAIKTNGKGVNTIVPQSALLAGLVYLEDIAKKPATARDFYEGVTEGANLSEGSPILALRNRVINVRASGGRLDAAFAWPTVAKAISYFERGEKVTKLRWTKSSGKIETPDLFDSHIERLTPVQNLVDLQPATAKDKAAK